MIVIKGILPFMTFGGCGGFRQEYQHDIWGCGGFVENESQHDCHKENIAFMTFGGVGVYIYTGKASKSIMIAFLGIFF
jgi:hypothetical protein